MTTMPTHRAECRPRAFLELVVTPESIPQFIIPRLGRTSRNLGTSCPPAPDMADLCRGDQEPGTRLAMSLPHLRRVTTPYGFLALGESPCVSRKESLFFGGPEEEGWVAIKARIVTGPKDLQKGQPRSCGPPAQASLHLMRGISCNSLPSPEPSPPTSAGKTRRSFSWDLSAPSRHFRLGVPEGKTRLQRLIRKHLPRAQKKRRARGSSSTGGKEEHNGSSGS